ncbi:GntR family transcriptional regulator [Nonomuraea typhae]|uniref:GntR family transcriptional regulator n=1 Tax=Nonomuraea typhae TaxID=2603600 RepID=A0ABW7YS44_9ACTN
MTDPEIWKSVSVPYIRSRADGEAEAWAQEAAEHGHTGSQQIRSVTEVQPPRDVRAALGTPDGEPAVVRQRLILLDEVPVELADSYYPVRIARGTRLAEARKIPGGAVTLLDQLGHRPARVEEDISARPATAEERQLLQLADGEWVLVLLRRILAANDEPVEVSVLTMVASGRHLRYDLTV